jgi:hypothetical protein
MSLLLLAILIPQIARHPAGCSFGREGLSLAGKIGSAPIRVHLDTGSESRFDDGIFGTFVYTKTWSPASSAPGLDGTFSENCRRMELEESDEAGNVNARWVLRFKTDRHLEGTRDDDGSRSAIAVDVVSPVDCAARGWRRFSSTSWPVTFEYPANWRLSEGPESIRIQCPDPERLAIGYEGIEITNGAGQGEPVRDEERQPGIEIGGFTNFEGRGWWHGESCDGTAEDETHVFCERARVSHRDGMTILYGTGGEHRLYRPGGGYIGQGNDWMEYVFLLPDQWIDILSDADDEGVMPRVSASVKPSAHHHAASK